MMNYVARHVVGYTIQHQSAFIHQKIYSTSGKYLIIQMVKLLLVVVIVLTVITPGADVCSIEKIFYDEDCFEPCPPTGGGGGAPPYRADPDPSPPCSIRIKKVFLSDIDEWREPIQMITIKNVKLE